MEAERLYWWALSLAPGIGVRRFYKLLEEYGSVQNIWECKPADLQTILPARIRKEFVEFRVNFDPEPRLKALQERGISLITLLDADYPNNLKDIIDPPPVLYILGQLKPRDSRSIAVVGSRRATPYGRATAERFGRELAELGFTVISGMARGIDTCAHRGCLAAGGRTIAVLGCGLDYVYPPENRTLMAKIAREGAVVTEFPLGTPPEAGHFPVRNRIISGLSQGVLVIESPLNSGTMITVNQALDQNRSVMAVPGRIDSPNAVGCHKLIRDGARLITCADDVIEELQDLMPRSRQQFNNTPHPTPLQAPATKPVDAPQPKLGDDERHLIGLLDEERHVDFLIRSSDLPASRVNALLVGLQLRRLVSLLPGGMVKKIERTQRAR